jgi:hypothetical protein
MPQRSIGKAARIQNVSTEQTVKNAAGILQRIILSNSGATGTLTIKDDTATLIVLNVPASTAAPVLLDFGIAFASSLKITPSATNVDVLVVYS